MIRLLAAGVFLSGFIKDLLCLPRPLSPPLQRITLSGSAALEYGFPSTHSTNAVSVAVYALRALRSASWTGNPTMRFALEGLWYLYAMSIFLGRLYCGMHSVLDVVSGSLLGAFLATIQYLYGGAFDDWPLSGSYTNPIIRILVVLLLVRIHPEPADDCPCFDDSVAFAGVMIGMEVGSWHFATTGLDWHEPMPSTVPFSLEKLGWTTTIVRIILGVSIVFAWRATMKPLLLRLLPPVFRHIEYQGLIMPRKFFVNAS